MGCSVSIPEDEELDPFIREKRINDAIEQNMNRTKVNDRKEVKLLLLGAGESGKSTVLKQLKLLHKGGFTQQERAQYSQVIWCDVIQLMKILIVQARKLGIELDADRAGSPLALYLAIVLRTGALDQVDAGTAGGTDFLIDYDIRYGEKNMSKRRVASTGIADGLLLDDLKLGAEDEELGNDILFHTANKKVTHTRQEIAEAIHQLWILDKGIQKCFERTNEFQFEGSANYYFDNIFQFADPFYLCTDTDILKGRIKTTGITETSFVVDSLRIKVLDAGGQRSERKKWIHFFDNITAIIFVLAISEYDQMLFEDERVNRMHEAIVLFDTLCNSRWFVTTPFILFLNKIDIFEKKIVKSPLRKYFPDYNGRAGSVEDGIKFFESNFLKLNRTKKPIYVHRTCATDTKSMKFVLSAVTDLMVQQNLQNSGII